MLTDSHLQGETKLSHARFAVGSSVCFGLAATLKFGTRADVAEGKREQRRCFWPVFDEGVAHTPPTRSGAARKLPKPPCARGSGRFKIEMNQGDFERLSKDELIDLAPRLSGPRKRRAHLRRAIRV
jgi:hypothetical protein